MANFLDAMIAAGPGLAGLAGGVAGNAIMPGLGGMIGAGLGGTLGSSLSAGILGNRYEDAYNQARRANEQRYNQILGGYDQLIGSYGDQANALLGGYRQREGMIDSYGNAARNRLGQMYDQQIGSAGAGIFSRGLANTSVLANRERGINADRANSMLGLEDALTRQRFDLSGQTLSAQQNLLGQQAQLGLGRLGFMANRNDPYPQQPNLSGIMQTPFEMAKLFNPNNTYGNNTNIGGQSYGVPPSYGAAPGQAASPWYQTWGFLA